PTRSSTLRLLRRTPAAHHFPSTTLFRSLIYASISGFGPDGPGRDRPGLDSALQAETGLLEICGEPDGPPQRIGTHIVDVTTGHRSEEHTSELQSRENLVCRLLLEQKKQR